MRRLLNSVWFFWFVLTIPFLWIVYDRLANQAPGGKLFYWTGVFGVWLILASLAVTPLQRIFRGADWTRWLMKRRRYMGVAAFGYSLLHTVYWLQLQKSIGTSIRKFSGAANSLRLDWPFSSFVAMAATSNDLSVRGMGPNWKRLQRWVYLAAPLTLLHWFMAEHYRLKTVLIYGGLLAVIFVARLYVRRRRMRA